MGIEIGSLAWFEERARNSIVRISLPLLPANRCWDFSDSACLWGPRSAKIYDEVQGRTQQYGQAVTAPEVNLINAISANLVTCLPDRLAYIDLGPGTEGKEGVVISEMISQGKDIVYLPVDVNREMLMATAARVRNDTGLTVVPLHRAFEDLEWSGLLAEIPELSRRIPFVSLGLTFTNYEPVGCIRMLQRITGRQGTAFITAQLRDGTNLNEVKNGYRSELARRLFENKLALIGIRPDDVGEPVITDEVLVFYPIIRPSSIILEKGGVANDMLLTHRAHRYSLDQLTQTIDLISGQNQFLDTLHPPSFAAVLLKSSNH